MVEILKVGRSMTAAEETSLLITGQVMMPINPCQVLPAMSVVQLLYEPFEQRQVQRWHRKSTTGF